MWTPGPYFVGSIFRITPALSYMITESICQSDSTENFNFNMLRLQNSDRQNYVNDPAKNNSVNQLWIMKLIDVLCHGDYVHVNNSLLVIELQPPHVKLIIHTTALSPFGHLSAAHFLASAWISDCEVRPLGAYHHPSSCSYHLMKAKIKSIKYALKMDDCPHQRTSAWFYFFRTLWFFPIINFTD